MTQLRLLACAALVGAALVGAALLHAQAVAEGKTAFAARCAGCHGTNGTGGEVGPNITDAGADTLFLRPLGDIITHGVPDDGMPAFALPKRELDALVAYITALRAPAAAAPPAGNVAAGEHFYFGVGGCANCHTIRGNGSAIGPDLSNLGRERRLTRIAQALRQPGTSVGSRYRVVSVTLRDGRTLRGMAKNESNYDLQLQDLDGEMHYLSKDDVTQEHYDSASLMPPVAAGPDTVRDLLAFLSRLTTDGPGPRERPATRPSLARDVAAGDWPTYNGNLNGNRYSALNEIDTTTVRRLAPAWMFPIANANRLEGTPVVVDGTMFVTTANEAYALDAASGRPIWHYARPLTKGVIGDAAGAINRGVAVLGDRVFMVTDHAHLVALSRLNGKLLWDVAMADFHKHYGATGAPLVVNDLVLSGTSGGDEGDRGFLAAYDAQTGARVWRVWTIPSRGEPLDSTWRGRALEHGCGAAWLTGTYDAGTGLLYWPTGNPCPDYNGDERRGDNLYSSSVLALDPRTGAMRWYYQFTPHNVHDWDASETLALIDADFHGQPRKLLVQANRNGFFYVLDRITGQLLLSTPFVHKLTWSSGIGADGRPVVLPGSDPTVRGVRVCPSLEGATNWMSTAFNPSTHLYYVMALESCSIFTKSSAWWQQGKSFYGGGASRVPGEQRQKVLRAIDPQTGKIAWELPQIGDGESWGGVLSTAGGLVFYGDDGGALAAVNASTGTPLWHFNTNESWHASPMTYAVHGTQYVAVAAGSTIVAFALLAK
jgi:alcohol dehydrogenase (cytochrome c)